MGEWAKWDPGPGGAKISARGNGYHFAGWIAPDLSHACGWHRPRHDRSPSSPNPAGWYIHGAAQNRRGTVLTVSYILGAPSFSPHLSWALSPFRPLAPTAFSPHPAPVYGGRSRTYCYRRRESMDQEELLRPQEISSRSYRLVADADSRVRPVKCLSRRHD